MLRRMNVLRIDKSQLGSARRTDEGYIEDRPIVTRTGVFLYQDGGNVRRELRHPDDVFAADSLASLSMLPVTMGHPDAPVSAANAKALSIGMTGERPTIDGSNVLAAVRITDADAVAGIEGGRRELSLGYRVDLLEEAGTYNGQPYTHRQTNIRYNHLAVVDRGRMGATARINIDGEMVDEPDTRKDHNMPELISIRLDSGLSYQAAPEIAHALEAIRKDAADTAAKLTAETARADKAEGERDAAAEKLAKLESERGDTAAIADAVKARLALLKAAESIGFKSDTADTMSDREVREAVIKGDSADLDLSDKSDEYVAARFDAIVELRGDVEAARADAIAKQRKAVTPNHKPDARTDAAVARERYIASLDYRTREKAAV